MDNIRLCYVVYFAFLSSTIFAKNIDDLLDDFISGDTDIVMNATQVASSFSVSRSRPVKGQRHLGRHIKFNEVQYNVGGDFNKKSGVYTAPVDGVYVFKYFSGKLPKKLMCKLIKNEFEISNVEIDGVDPKKRKGQCTRVVLQLQQSDIVYLLVVYDDLTNEQTRDSLDTTSFSGRLLVDTNSEIIKDIRRPTQAGRQNMRHRRNINDNVAQQKLIKVITESPMVSMVQSPMLSAHEETPVVTPAQNGGVAVAFSVTCTKSILGSRMVETYNSYLQDNAFEVKSLEQSDGRIQFDKVFVNIGNGFNLTSHEFKAPVKGVYFFSFNVGKFPRKLLSVIFVKNLNEVQVLIYNDERSAARAMQSQSVMLQLNEGETVWLRAYESDDYGVYSNHGNYITFSGYLVYRT